jgi:hypothetical protein
MKRLALSLVLALLAVPGFSEDPTPMVGPIAIGMFPPPAPSPSMSPIPVSSVPTSPVALPRAPGGASLLCACQETHYVYDLQFELKYSITESSLVTIDGNKCEDLNETDTIDTVTGKTLITHEIICGLAV